MKIVWASADVYPETDPLELDFVDLCHRTVVGRDDCEGDPRAASEGGFEAIVMAWNAEL